VLTCIELYSDVQNSIPEQLVQELVKGKKG